MGGFECVENTSKINKDFTKKYNEDSSEGYSLKGNV